MDVENAKKILYESEPRAIYLRTQKIESKLQDILQKYNSILLTENELQKLNKNQGILLFKIKVDMQEQLKFLDEWKGLKIQTPQQLTQDEYNKKSRNWLNGRRAINYGNLLFPACLKQANQFVDKVGIFLFGNTKQKNDYVSAIFYKLVFELYVEKINMNEKRRKKVPFFCRNSILKKSKLRNILQEYALEKLVDRNIHTIKGFPSCYEDGFQAFTKISEECIRKYKQKWCNMDIDMTNIDDANNKHNINRNNIGINISQTNTSWIKIKKRKHSSESNSDNDIKLRNAKRAKTMCYDINSISIQEHNKRMTELHNRYNNEILKLKQELERERKKSNELMTMNFELQRQNRMRNTGQPQQSNTQTQQQCIMLVPNMNNQYRTNLPIMSNSNHNKIISSNNYSINTNFNNHHLNDRNNNYNGDNGIRGNTNSTVTTQPCNASEPSTCATNTTVPITQLTPNMSQPPTTFAMNTNNYNNNNCCRNNNINNTNNINTINNYHTNNTSIHNNIHSNNHNNNMNRNNNNINNNSNNRHRNIGILNSTSDSSFSPSNLNLPNDRYLNNPTSNTFTVYQNNSIPINNFNTTNSINFNFPSSVDALDLINNVSTQMPSFLPSLNNLGSSGLGCSNSLSMGSIKSIHSFKMQRSNEIF